MDIETVPANACDFYFISPYEAEIPPGGKVLLGGAPVGSDRDTGLTEESKQKTAALALELKNKLGTIGAVYSSPYKRTLQMVEPLGLKVAIEPSLNELDHGKALLDAGENWKETDHWKNYSKKTPLEKLTTPQSPGAETDCDVIQRVHTFVRGEGYKHLGQKVVCAADNDTMRAILKLKSIEQHTGPIVERFSSSVYLLVSIVATIFGIGFTMRERWLASASCMLVGLPAMLYSRHINSYNYFVKGLPANTQIDEPKHFKNGEILHIRVFPKGRIEVIPFGIEKFIGK